MNPFLLLVSAVSLMNSPGSQSRVVPESPARLAASRESYWFWKETMKRWESEGDSVATVGALRGGMETWPERTRLFAFDIGRILQSEGRLEEASNWYWFKVERRDGTLDLGFSPWEIFRVFDALEDAGRRRETTLILESVKLSRRELYVHSFDEVGEPFWTRKFARKLLKDDPKDERAQEALRFAERDIARQVAHPDQFVSTRDVPHEGRGK